MRGVFLHRPHDFRRISTFFDQKITDSTGPPPYIVSVLSVHAWWDALRSVGRSRYTGGEEVRWLLAVWVSGEHEAGNDMSDRDGHPALHPTRIEIPPEICLYLMTLLNHTLACTVDLRSQVKQAA